MTISDLLAQAQQALQTGDRARARTIIDKVLAQAPNDPGAHALLAAERRAAGDLPGALDALTRAIAAAPSPAALFNRAGVFLELGRASEARTDLLAALAMRPDHAPSWSRLARAHEELGAFAEAVTATDQALQRTGPNADLLYDRARCLAALGRHAEAAQSYAESYALRPDETARVNRAASLYELDRLQEAEEELRASLRVHPSPEAYGNLGRTLLGLGRLVDARAAFDVALARGAPPQQTESLRYYRALACLSLHEFEAGFADYEARWAAGAIAPPALDRDEAAWDGRALRGALRVWGEQGLGEEILFARFLPAARECVSALIVECSPRLQPLLARSVPDVAFSSAPAGRSDAQSSLASLGAVLGVGAHALDGAPYLQADDNARAALRARYEAAARGRPLIGIAWRSQGRHYGAQKSSTLTDWGALLTRDALFINLQYGDSHADVTAARDAFKCDVLTDETIDQMANIDAFAAQVAAMDAIVSVSNTTVHIAGALGVSCFVLAPPARGRLWYWGVEGETTPWYKSVRLVRRTPDESWAAQVARAAALTFG